MISEANVSAFGSSHYVGGMRERDQEASWDEAKINQESRRQIGRACSVRLQKPDIVLIKPVSSPGSQWRIHSHVLVSRANQAREFETTPEGSIWATRN